MAFGKIEAVGCTVYTATSFALCSEKTNPAFLKKAGFSVLTDYYFL